MEKVGDVPRAGGTQFSKQFSNMFFPVLLIGKDRIPVPFDSPSVALKTLLRRS